jgi:NAD(P)-dependent dehydrogenase (short-subunit alcohol dehydrogenase family)
MGSAHSSEAHRVRQAVEASVELAGGGGTEEGARRGVYGVAAAASGRQISVSTRRRPARAAGLTGSGEGLIDSQPRTAGAVAKCVRAVRRGCERSGESRGVCGRAGGAAMAGARRPTALITGANRGLGLELAKLLLARGWSVIAASRTPPTVTALADLAAAAAAGAATGAGPAATPALTFLPLDVTQAASRAAAAAALAPSLSAEGRGLDVLVNNAGVYPSVWSGEACAAAVAANTAGPLLLAREDLRPFLAPGAHVVNVSSGYAALKFVSPAYRARLAAATTVPALLAAVAYDAGDAWMAAHAPVPPYNLSKAALNRGTALLAAELAPARVRVTSVSPG